MTDAKRRLDLCRRELLFLLAGGAGAFTAPEILLADDLDRRVTQIVTENIAVDLHNHVPNAFVQDAQADSKKDPEVALASEMKRAGFAALCYTYPVDRYTHLKPGEYYQLHLQALDQTDRLLAQQKMRRAFTWKDLQTAHAHGHPIIIQTCEGAQFLEGHLDRVAEAYRRGLRLMQLVHHANDLVSPLGDIQTRPPNEFGGLTPFGAQVVKECNRLHLLMDLAHAAFPMVKGVLDTTTQPIIISHNRPGHSPGTRGQARILAAALGHARACTRRCGRRRHRGRLAEFQNSR